MIKALSFAARYLKYLIKSKHNKGHGIHSPFLYNFTREVIFSKREKCNFKEIEIIIKELKNDKSLIQINDYGAGSRIFRDKNRRISNIAKVTSTKKKYGKLLYRMIEYFDMKNILELGTSLGIGTMYLAYSKNAKVYTVEGDPSIYQRAKNTFQQIGLINIKSINDKFEHALPGLLNEIPCLDMVYFDGNHKLEPTLNYFEQCLTKITNNIFISI